MPNPFDIWSRDELFELLAELEHQNELPNLRPSHVPANLHPLIHYAEAWGRIIEEAGRNEFVDSAPALAVENLCHVVSAFEPALMTWLAGPEAKNETPTPEYVAFTYLLMTADYGCLKLDRKMKS